MGAAIARTFGTHGFHVALIARNRTKLDALAGELAGEGIDAAAFPADVLDHAALTTALTDAAGHFGGIDVLEYSPNPGAAGTSVTTPSETTPADVQTLLEFQFYGALAATAAVLPGMREAGSGTLLYTTGAGSLDPIPMLGNANAVGAALRNWVLNLNKELDGTRVHAAHVAIGVWIGPGGPPDVPTAAPEQIAPVYWELHSRRDQAERVFTG
jgi:NADP-dependent 3-hydroxy acid dehydrogenase YdfG